MNRTLTHDFCVHTQTCVFGHTCFTHMYVSHSSHTCAQDTCMLVHTHTHTPVHIHADQTQVQSPHPPPTYLIRKWTQTILSDWGPRPPDTTVAWVWVHR